MLLNKSLLIHCFCIILNVKGIRNSDTPRFRHGSYSYFMKMDVSGLIGIVEATIDDPNPDPITYRFETDDEILKVRVKEHPNAGILELTGYLPPGIYEGAMIATNSVTGSFSSADVLIWVEAEVECPVEKVTTVNKTMMVRRLKEEQVHPYIELARIDNCVYKIESQWPPNTNFIEIDEPWIKSSKFDRESEIFANMTTPQFRAVLKLECPNDTKSRSFHEDEGEYVLLNDIDFSIDTTILSIIIEDINDNAPVFVKPDKDIIIGYPSSEVAQQILPEFLYQVEAYDIDDGLNAKISYRIDTNSHFTIDRESGIIAPLPQAMHDVNVIDLTVRAFDRNGESGANFVVAKIKVMKLLPSNLVSVFYENKDRLSHEQVLAEIQRESKMNLLFVKMTTVPKIYNESDVIPFDYEQATLVNIIGYGLNIKNNRPMSSDDLMNILSPLLSLTVVPYNDTYGENCDPVLITDTQDLYKILFIIFASILGSVIVLIVIILILLYSYLIKPFRQQVEAESRTVSKVSETDMEGVRHPRAKGRHKYQKSGEKRVSFGTTRRLNETNSFPVRAAFDLEDDRKFSVTDSIGSNDSESDNQRRETLNLQFQAFMKKIDRLDGDGSEAKGLEVLPEEK